MPKDDDHLVAGITGSDTSGWLSSLLAEEDAFDRRVLWRLGTWAFCAVGALVVAVLAAQSSMTLRRDRVAYAELTRQAQQIQWIAKESQDETRRLAAAVDTLNKDRDRLYSRVTVMEQGLDSVTGSINKQANTAPSSSAPGSAAPSSTTASAAAPSPTVSAPPSVPMPVVSPPPVTAPVAVTSPAPVSDKKADQKTADIPKAAETKADSKDADKNAPVMASVSALSDIREVASAKTVQRTDFGVDIGTANSVEGLRALWRGALASQNALLGGLQPIIVVKERTDGFGLQLRLVAGPLADAATAARICARLSASKRECATSVYDGQRLALGGETSPTPPPANTTKQRRSSRAKTSEAQAPAPAPTGLNAWFGSR